MYVFVYLFVYLLFIYLFSDIYKISRDVPANIRSSAVLITCLEFLSAYGLLIVQHINWSILHNYINPT